MYNNLVLKDYELEDQDSQPLTFPIPDESPGEGSQTPDTGNSHYQPGSSYPEIHEGELDKPADPKLN